MQTIMTIEEARTESGDELVGFRLTTSPGFETILVFADQRSMPGFRVGSEFVPSYGDRISYRTVNALTVSG